MAVRRINRGEARAIRRKAFYLPKTQDRGSCEMARISAAYDYVRALLDDADPQVRTRVGEQLVNVLLSTAAVLEPKPKGGRR